MSRCRAKTRSLNHLKGAIFARFSVYDLSVIPLFLLMGQFATQGGLSRSLFAFASSLIGHLRGGMAMAAMLACAAFGAICGSSVATAATVAQVALPEMRRFAIRAASRRRRSPPAERSAS